MYWALIWSIVLMYGILIGVNIPAPLIGLNFENDSPGKRLSFEPPGYIIPVVWFVLFTLFGIARYLLLKTGRSSLQIYSTISLAFLCATYAYYTLGFAKITGLSALWFGLWGNIAVIVASIIVSFLLYRQSVTAALLILPTVAWTIFATIIVLGRMKQEGLI